MWIAVAKKMKEGIKEKEKERRRKIEENSNEYMWNRLSVKEVQTI